MKCFDIKFYIILTSFFLPFSKVFSQNIVFYDGKVVDLEDTADARLILSDAMKKYPFPQVADSLNNIVKRYAEGKGGKFSVCNLYFRELFEYATKANDDERCTRALSSIASMQMWLGNWKDAEKYHRHALTYKDAPPRVRAFAHSNFGTYWRLTHQFDSSIHYIKKGIEIIDKVDNVELAHYFTNAGAVCNRMERYDDAIMYNKKALDIGVKTNNMDVVQRSLCGRGETYILQKQYDKVLYVDSIILKTENIPYGVEQEVLLRRASIYYNNGNLKKALRYVTQMAKLAEEKQDISTLGNSFANMAMAYDELGMGDSAKFYMGKMEELSAKKADNKELEGLLTYQRYEQAKKRKNYQEALVNFEKNKAINDSIQNVRRKEIAIAAAELLQGKEKENQIKSLENIRLNQDYENLRLKNRNILIFVVSLSVFVLTGVFFLVYLFRQKNQKLKERYETTIRLNRARMNPHFIFNSLNSIRYYISENAGNLAEGYLIRFSELMRHILEQSGQDTISLSEELKTLELYLELEQQRLENRFDFLLETDTGIDMHQTAFPSLILQPFAENAVKHAFGGTRKQKGLVRIHIGQHGRMLAVSISDNGPGMEAGQPGGASFGMKLTRDRIENYAALHGTEAEFTVDSSPEGTRISFRVPHKSIQK